MKLCYAVLIVGLCVMCIIGCAVAPTPTPTSTLAPTQMPTPTSAPTPTPAPAPTQMPTSAPTAAPTQTPTSAPTAAPTQMPTPTPTAAPTLTPTPTPDPVVRFIYATPSDREFNHAYAQGVEETIYNVQGWFSDQLGGHTFMVDHPVLQHCTLESPGDYYARAHGWDRIIRDLQHCDPVEHFSSQYVWAIYADVPFDCEHSTLGRGGAGVVIHHGEDLKGLVSTEPFSICEFPIDREDVAGALAHELGHAFGLEHPPGCDEGLETCDANNLMWHGWALHYPDTYLSDADKEMLLASPFFRSR